MPATRTEDPLAPHAGAPDRKARRRRAGPLPHCVSSVPRRNAAFTLLELLAVVVILAIVWAFVFPATDAVRRSALRREAIADAQSLATAVLLYRDTYGYWPLQGQAPTPDLDIVYATNLTVVAEAATLLDHAALIRAITPQPNDNPDNPRQRAFLELDSNRLQAGCFTDPWSATNRPSPYVVAVDANGDGWIGRPGDGNTLQPITVYQAQTLAHPIPAIQEPVYVFSWSDTTDATNRISTLRHQ